MAGKTIFREDRPNVAIEANRVFFRGCPCDFGAEVGKQQIPNRRNDNRRNE